MSLMNLYDQTLLFLLTNELDTLFGQNLSVRDIKNLVYTSKILTRYFIENYSSNYFDISFKQFKNRYIETEVLTPQLTKLLTNLLSGFNGFSHLKMNTFSGSGVYRSGIGPNLEFQSISGQPAIVAHNSSIVIKIYLINNQLLASDVYPGISASSYDFDTDYFIAPESEKFGEFVYKKIRRRPSTGYQNVSFFDVYQRWSDPSDPVGPSEIAIDYPNAHMIKNYRTAGILTKTEYLGPDIEPQGRHILILNYVNKSVTDIRTIDGIKIVRKYSGSTLPKSIKSSLNIDILHLSRFNEAEYLFDTLIRK